MTLGIDYQNPLNVTQPPGDTWNGSVGTGTNGLAIFLHVIYGVRAACRNLAQYQNVGGLNQIDSIINRWAPASDGNEPQKYAWFVAARIAETLADASVEEVMTRPLHLFAADGEINKRTMLLKLIRAMAQYEQYAGYRMCEDDLRSGVALYEHDFPHK